MHYKKYDDSVRELKTQKKKAVESLYLQGLGQFMLNFNKNLLTAKFNNY